MKINYNYKYSDYNLNPYFNPTSFNSDITNLALHNSNQPSMPDWSYPNQYMSQSQYYEQEWDSSPLFTESGGYNSPESYYQQPYQQTASYTPHQDEPIEKNLL